MGKRKRGSRSVAKKLQDVEPDVDDVDVADENFFSDEIDRFHLGKEKILLADAGSDNEYESDEEEVLGIHSDDDDDEDEDDYKESYDDGDDVPSMKAWGKKKSDFYGTDVTENLEGSDREEAERVEEEEVLAIQRRLAEQIDDEDCGLNLLQSVSTASDQSTTVKSVVEADFSSLSKKAQWKLVKKQSPELLGLLDDYMEILEELETGLTPLLHMVNKGKIPKGLLSDFLKLKYRLYLNYILNISFYLMLKFEKASVRNHPVISRLIDYKSMINKLAPSSKEFKPEIDKLLQDYDHSDGLADEVGQTVCNLDMVSEPLQIPKKKTKSQNVFQISGDGITQSSGLKKNTDGDLEFSKSMTEMLLDEEKVKNQIDEVSKDEEDDRRAINYQIAKNKGLKQKKRKLDRNPRVKMREKFRKARIRRRGQVREYKPELTKYSGEASGIRIGVKKSVTLQ